MPHTRFTRWSGSANKSSQETRSASTPVMVGCAAAAMTSPSISRISSESAVRSISGAPTESRPDSVRSNESNASQRAAGPVPPWSRSNLSPSSDSNSEDIISANVTKETAPKAVKWSGPWASLAPRDPKSILGQITANPTHVQMIAEDWLAKNHRDRKKLITIMMQFFVDLAGYQDLDVTRFFDFEHSNTSNELVKIMGGHGGHVEPKTVFCFMNDTTQSRSIETIVGHFLDAWIDECLDARLLFDDQTYGHIFNFVTAMTDHTRKKKTPCSVLITGAILVLKLNTATLKAYLKFRRDNNDDSDMKSKRIEQLQRQLKHWYALYQLNVEKFFERPCHMIALKCMEELAVWMKLDPAYYVNSMNIKYVMRRVQLDTDNQVCMAAMRTCLKIVDIAEAVPHLQLRIQRFVTGIEGRIRDANPKVQMMAIKIFHKMMMGEWYLDYVTYPICSEISKEIFNDHNLELAKAAANFFIIFNKIYNSSEVDSLTVFPKLIKEFEKLKLRNGVTGVEHLTHRLVEACWEDTPQFEHSEYYVQCLLDLDYEMDLKHIMLDIMAIAIGYFLTGKLPVHRGKASKEKPATSQDHCELLQVLGGSISELFEVMTTDRSMRKFTEILTLIDYTVCPYAMFPAFFETIAVDIKENLEDTRDETVIKNLVTLMDALSENVYFTTNRELEEIQNEYVTKVNRNQKADDVLKLAHILSKFDAHRKLKYEQLEQGIEENSHILIVWKWSLVWMLRKTKRTNANHNCDVTEEVALLSEEIKLFKKYLKMFLHKVLLNLHLKFSSMFLAFEELCSLYEVMHNELKDSDLRKDMFVELGDRKIREIVSTFLQKTVLTPIPSNASENLKNKRRDCFKNYIHLCNFNGLPQTDVFVVFRFYKLLHDEYGYIIDGLLEAMDKGDASEPKTYVSSLMVLFFYEWYKEIVEQDGGFSLQSSQAKGFKSCARAFLASKVMSNPGYQKQFVMCILDRFLPRETEHAFLYITVHVTALSKNERNEVLAHIKGTKWTKTRYVELAAKELRQETKENVPSKKNRTVQAE